MNVVRPVTITDSEFVSSTIVEDDWPDWAGGTTYADGDRVIYEHYIYESLQGSNTGKTPDAAASEEWWLLVGPTNMWGMFDQEINTGSQSGTTTLTVVVEPGAIIDTVALLDVVGTSATVSMVNGVTTVFTQTVSLEDSTVVNWKDYFFEPYDRVSQKVITGLPYYLSGVVTITINDTSGNASVGGIVFGATFDLGKVFAGATVSLDDYSLKETDGFGVVTFRRRNFAKRMSVSLLVANIYFKRVYNLLADLRATPCVWVAPNSTDKYSPLVIFGFYKDFSIDVQYADHSAMSLEIEGMI